MNQAGGIKPELQLRGANNRIERKGRFPFVSNTNLILKAKKTFAFLPDSLVDQSKLTEN